MPPDRDIADLASRVEALSDELADSRAERQRLVRELTQRSRAQADAREAIVALEERLASQERQAAVTAPSTTALTDTIRDLDRQLGARLAELAAAGAELDKLRASAAEREEELAERAAAAERELAAVRQELAAADGAREQADGASARDRAAADELVRALAVAETRAKRLEEELGREREEMTSLREAIELERRTRGSVEGRVAWLERELRAREAELAAAQRMVHRHEAALSEAQTTREERDVLARDRKRFVEERDAVEAKRKEAAAGQRRAEAELAARAREHQQLVGELGLRLGDIRADVERISYSRAWRWGHRITRGLRVMTFRRPVTEGAVNRALKRLDEARAAIGGPAPAALPKASPRPPRAKPAAGDADEGDDSHPSTAPNTGARDRLARQIRERLGPSAKLATWPRVSIVVVNRNGAAFLRALLAGLKERTDYPDFELVVVDNASEDDSVQFLRSVEPGFPLKVITKTFNASFSEANNEGADAAGGELLLFLNNDVEPFENGWLRELVARQRESGGAVGATLLHSEGRGPAGGPPYAVQHRGIRFGTEGQFGRAVNIGGDDPLGPQLGRADDVPAVTAACLLIDRDLYTSVGGFSGGYRYGTEDVDLGMKLLSLGESVVCEGRAVLLHHESATQRAEGRDFMRANRTVNRRLFLERWGPQLRRELALDRLGRDHFWSAGERLHIAVTRTSNDVSDGWGDWYTAQELGDAFEDAGVRVSYVQRKGDDWYDLPADTDYLLLLMDRYDLPRAGDVPAVAWVRNWTERWLEHEWFERLHLVLASSGISGQLIERVTGRSTPLFPLATNPDRFKPLPPDPELATDYVFTGNHWGVERAIEGALAPRKGERFAVFGKGWNKVRKLKKHARGVASYDQLPAIYSSSKVVVDDTAGPTLPYGAVNGRVFDALASGAAVITNCEAGVRELFDEDFPVWSSRESLRAGLDNLLADDDTRHALAERYRATVLAEHTYERRAAQLLAQLRRRAEALSFCIKIGAPDWEQAERWGDLHFARALRRELERGGHPTAIQVLNEWDEPAGLAYDVVIQLKGLSRYRPKPGQLNVMWVISHPEAVSPEECNGFDLIAVASKRFADGLRTRTQTPVIVLEQATDPDVFFPEEDPQFRHDVVYVGNSRGVMRKAVADMLSFSRDFAVYGSNWQKLIDKRHVVAEHIPNVELHRVYSSSKVVLNDHWDDMREHGFISNRVFDVLASGGLLVSDRMPELERFGDSVVTYDTPQELDALLAGLLADPVDRQRRAAGGRALVLREHTFKHRTAQLLGHLNEEIERGGFPLRIRPAGASASTRLSSRSAVSAP